MKNDTKILIADDDDLVREAVVKILEMFGHQVVSVDRGDKAVDALNPDFDVIILDINMPGMDGFDTMAAINERDLGIPVLFLTGAGSMEYAVKAINLGAYDFISKPIEDLDLFEVKIRRAIEKKMYVRRERESKDELEREVKAKTKELAEKNILLEEYNQNLEASAVTAITTLQVALEEKDQYTAGHTSRVTEYSLMIAKSMGLAREDVAVLDRACRLHDIGKLVIDLSCIQKPGALTDEEWLMIKKHPEIGQNIIKPLDFLAREGLVVRHHHERIDGRGYPDGISGSELDILTRIITVADSFDAMTSKRSYKLNMSLAEGVGELQRCAGSQFDPDVVKIFAGIIEHRRAHK